MKLWENGSLSVTAVCAMKSMRSRVKTSHWEENSARSTQSRMFHSFTSSACADRASEEGSKFEKGEDDGDVFKWHKIGFNG